MSDDRTFSQSGFLNSSQSVRMTSASAFFNAVYIDFAYVTFLPSDSLEVSSAFGSYATIFAPSL